MAKINIKIIPGARATVNLRYNSGFPWYSKGDCHVKGFAHSSSGQYLRTEALLEYFSDSSDFADFKKKVSDANGMFSVIVSVEGMTWFGVDRMRTFPLFYTFTASPELTTSSGRKQDKSIPELVSQLQISDSVDQIINSHGVWSLNQEASTEFLATGYVSGNETLAEGIYQVQAGEVIELDPVPATGDRLTRSFYSGYRTTAERSAIPPSVKTFKEYSEDMAEQFHRTSIRIFDRLVESLNGRTAVIALSGGYDSRFIAAILKKLKYPDVICFSYGRRDNPDMVRAEEVAAMLGLKYIPVEYTPEIIHGYMEDKRFPEYVTFTSNRVSMFFMQEYFAIKYLRDNALVPDDAVFIPGHSGDFFGGSMLIKHGLHKREEPLVKTIRRIYDIKYRWHQPGRADRQILLERIERSIREKDTSDVALPYSIHEDWDLREKFSKFIVNSCNIYSYFGYEYRLPLYDHELQDFFRNLPFELKADKRLYDKYLREKVFSEFNLNFSNELQTDIKTQQRARLKEKIKSLLPKFILPTTVSRQDPIFYFEITRVLRQDLERRGIKSDIRGNSYNSLIVQWYIEHLKGESQGG